MTGPAASEKKTPAAKAKGLAGSQTLVRGLDVLEAVAYGNGPERVLVTLGCSGWSPGQLEGEIGRNGWLTVKADPAIIFELPVEERFTAALALLGIDPVMLSGDAGRA